MEAFPMEGALLSIAHDVVACDLEDGLAILNSSTGAYYSLDEIGRLVWLRLAEGTTFAQLSHDVVDIYDCHAETVRADLKALLEQLHAAKLIQLGEATPA